MPASALTSCSLRRRSRRARASAGGRSCIASAAAVRLNRNTRSALLPWHGGPALGGAWCGCRSAPLHALSNANAWRYDRRRYPGARLMNAPAQIVPPYRHTPLFPLGKDTTTYRKLSADGVRLESIMGREVVVVARDALRDL